MVQGRNVDGVGVQEDDVGLLARCQRAYLAFQSQPFRPVHGRLPNHVARCQQLREVAFGGQRPLVHQHALQRHHGAHLGEEIGRHGAFDVGAERRLDSHLHGFEDRRHSVAHGHLDGHRNRNVRAFVGDRLPGAVGHRGHVDENVARTDHVLFDQAGELRRDAEIPEHVRRDRQVEIAADLPGNVVSGPINLAAHHHGQELVGRGKILGADAFGVLRVSGLVAMPLEIAQDGTAAGIREPADRRIRVRR